jgi:diadenosine tetraphosphate (Ap4A) HIT family hydrolase
VLTNDLCYARYDKYPVNPGRLLVILFHHVAGFRDALAGADHTAGALVRKAKRLLDERFHPDGFIIGVNIDRTAGQTMTYLHVHVIPRYAGDMEETRGEARG